MNKTLYVRDEDLPIWEQAAKLAGNRGLSLVVIEALRKYVEAERLKQSSEAAGISEGVL